MQTAMISVERRNSAIMRKKICLAGRGGMLGEAFYREFGKGYELMATDIDVNEKWLTFSDFRDFQ